MEYSIRQIFTDKELDGCFVVRNVVFVEEQNVPPWEELDHYDESAKHYGVFADDEIVATARLVILPNRIGKIGRVAVLVEHRRVGLASKMLQLIIESNEDECDSFVLDAQISAQTLYEKLGFVAEGDEFLDANIPHIRMTKQTKK